MTDSSEPVVVTIAAEAATPAAPKAESLAAQVLARVAEQRKSNRSSERRGASGSSGPGSTRTRDTNPKKPIPTDPLTRLSEVALNGCAKLEFWYIRPFNAHFFKTPCVTSPCRFFNAVPVQYHLECSPYYAYQDGEQVPCIGVAMEEYWFGASEPSQKMFVSLEEWFVDACLNHGTITDYDTLTTQTYVMVNRGFNGVKNPICPDANNKIHAMAALRCHTAFHTASAPSDLLKSLKEQRPLPEGFYALGGIAEGEVKNLLNIRWKKPYTLSEQHYVARCLLPEYATIIPPMFIPARTKPNLEKGFTKRVTPNDFRPEVMVADAARRAVKYVLDNIKNFVGDNSVGPDEVERLCRDHALARFGAKDTKSVDAYMEGVKVALHCPVDHADFKSSLAMVTKVGSFIKDEPYDGPKPPRYIMAPEVSLRGFCHALLFNAQRNLFGSPERRNPWCVKHLDDDARVQYVRNLFGERPVFNTDYSSMESCVNKSWITLIEQPMFTYLAPPPERVKVSKLFDSYIQSEYVVKGRHYEFNLPFPMRLSGQDHTSAGNFLCNIVWMCTIVNLITGHFPDPTTPMVFEGDDGLLCRTIKLQNGDVVELKADDVASWAERLGLKLKLVECSNCTDSSFCGMKMAPSERTEGRKEELALDTIRTLSKVLWLVGFDRVSSKHDRALCYARVLSFMQRAAGNTELYRALWYIGNMICPRRNVLMTTWFRQYLYKLQYKGDSVVSIDVEDTMSLAKFAAKHNLPILGKIAKPEILMTKQELPNSVEVVYLPDLRKELNNVRLTEHSNMTAPVEEVVFNPKHGVNCVPECVERLIGYSLNVEVVPGKGTRRQWFREKHPDLAPGFFFTLRDADGLWYRIGSDGEEPCEPLRSGYFISLVRGKTGHAVVCKRTPMDTGEFYGAREDPDAEGMIETSSSSAPSPVEHYVPLRDVVPSPPQAPALPVAVPQVDAGVGDQLSKLPSVIKQGFLVAVISLLCGIAFIAFLLARFFFGGIFMVGKFLVPWYGVHFLISIVCHLLGLTIGGALVKVLVMFFTFGALSNPLIVLGVFVVTSLCAFVVFKYDLFGITKSFISASADDLSQCFRRVKLHLWDTPILWLRGRYRQLRRSSENPSLSSEAQY